MPHLIKLEGGNYFLFLLYIIKYNIIIFIYNINVKLFGISGIYIAVIQHWLWVTVAETLRVGSVLAACSAGDKHPRKPDCTEKLRTFIAHTFSLFAVLFR